jgi:hypothetical protein
MVQQASTRLLAVMGVSGLPPLWEPQTYTIGSMVAHRKSNGTYGLWIANDVTVAGDEPGVSAKWDRSDMTGMRDLIRLGSTDGLWPGKTRTSRPNSTARLVEVWDGAAWIPTHYDSGVREVSALLSNGWTAGGIYMRRTSGIVVINTEALTNPGADKYEFATLPAGFRPPPGVLSRFALYTTAMGWSRGYVDPLTGRATLSGYTAATPLFGEVHMGTTEGIPTSLPGTLVTTAP